MGEIDGAKERNLEPKTGGSGMENGPRDKIRVRKEVK